MLTLHDDHGRWGRRDFLRVGSLALGGLTLPGVLAAQARAAKGDRLWRDKSVIFLFLHGGPSQIETFDPKMTATSEIRSANGEVATRHPGITFGSAFPRLAALSDKLTVVRSFRTGDGNHDIKPVVGKDTLKANLGSLVARIVGPNHPTTAIPTNVMLFPRAVDPSTQPGTEAFGKFTATGSLGAAYAPFVPGGGGDMQRDMRLSLPRTRLDDRRRLLRGLDQLKRTVDAGSSADADRIREQAFSVILSGVDRAFDLSREDPRTIQRYDTAPLVRPEAISRKWNNYNNYVDNAKSLGKLLLLARRLCEAGCGFVTVTTNFVWDNHADVNNCGVEEGMRYMGTPLDHCVSAFIEDCAARGLSEKILLVVTGEMGRTPRLNNQGGRDHWGNLAPLLLTGGGLPMGQVIGQSSRDAGEPAADACGIPNLLATIMHTLFDVSQLRLARGISNEIINVATAAEPIRGLA